MIVAFHRENNKTLLGFTVFNVAFPLDKISHIHNFSPTLAEHRHYRSHDASAILTVSLRGVHRLCAVFKYTNNRKKLHLWKQSISREDGDIPHKDYSSVVPYSRHKMPKIEETLK
jgi:hypothetical protein